MKYLNMASVHWDRCHPRWKRVLCEARPRRALTSAVHARRDARNERREPRRETDKANRSDLIHRIIAYCFALIDSDISNNNFSVA